MTAVSFSIVLSCHVLCCLFHGYQLGWENFERLAWIAASHIMLFKELCGVSHM